MVNSLFLNPRCEVCGRYVDADALLMSGALGDVITCPTHTPAPAGVSAATTSRDRPIGPAGAPLYSEDRCDNGHVLDCCGGCKCERTQQI